MVKNQLVANYQMVTLISQSVSLSLKHSYCYKTFTARQRKKNTTQNGYKATTKAQ